jgi:hypothetical protein
MDFKKKYLKYKKKYLELQNKLNGGKFPLIDNDINVPNDDPTCMFDIFLIACLTRNYNLNVQCHGSDYICHLKKFIGEYGQDNNFTYEYDMVNRRDHKLIIRQSNGTRINFNRKDLVDWMKPRVINQIVPNHISKLIDPNDNVVYLHHVEPVNVLLEVSLGIGSATAGFVEIMNTRIQNNGCTYIIDYQNVLNILMSKIDIWGYENYRIPLNYTEKKILAIKQIKNFIVSRNGYDKVILIYKPSGGDYEFDPDNSNIITTDFLLTYLCDHSNLGLNNLEDYEYNNGLDEINTGQINYRLSTTQLEIISYNMINYIPNVTLPNNYDDLTFWMIGVGYYKLYESYNKINNIYFVTNDKQKLDNTHFKNILNLGLDPNNRPLDVYHSSINNIDPLIQRIEYVPSNTNIDDVYITSRKVVINDDRISQCLQILYSALYEAHNSDISILLNSEEIRKTIFERKFWFDNIIEMTGEMNYENGMTLFNAILYSKQTIYTAKLRQDGQIKYILPYYFYAYIKYIQLIKYGNVDGSMNSDQIEALFYNGV